MNSILDKFTIERSLIYVLILAVLITFGFIFYLFWGGFTKNIQIISPVGGEEWEPGQIYKITWKAKNIDKVGVVLFKGEEPQWIAKDVPAAIGAVEWRIYHGQEYGPDYWIAVFEYPWQKGNKIAYSDGSFSIIYPQEASCDSLSIQNEWPYASSDIPGLRRVFITDTTYSGNLEGLDGADKKCQEEAEKRGFTGTWQAFIGGDSDQDIAVERLKRTSRKKDGVFVEAAPAATLTTGAVCHRLLGRDFNEFIAKFSNLSVINEDKLGDTFFQGLDDVWMGRFNEISKKNCIPIEAVVLNPYVALAEKYSSTTTCQNWTKGDKFVEGYPVPSGQSKPPFSTCYTPGGKLTDAVSLGGLSTGVTGGGIGSNAFTPYQGKTCDTRQRLLCIEE